MSFTRWVVYASFTGGIIALSLQPSGIANATQPSIFLVADQSPGSSQDTQRDSRRGNKGMSDAESSGKMQGDKSSLPGGGRSIQIPSSMANPLASRGRDAPGRQAPRFNHRGSGGPSAPPSSSNPGMSGAGTGAGSR